MADLLSEWLVLGVRQEVETGPRQEGRPVRDDLVQRDFTATAANELWLADITEHRTLEGKLYLCAIKDKFSTRIVGYSIDSRMKSRIAVNALNTPSPAAGTSPAACCIRTVDRSFEAGSTCELWSVIPWSGRLAGSVRPATTPPWRASSASCRRTS